MNIKDLRTGDIVFFKPSDLIGNIISRQQEIPYCHCGIVVNDWNIPFINESLLHNGVRSINAQDRLNDEDVCVVRYDRLVTEIDFAVLANNKLGLKYNIKGVLIYQVWLQLTGKWKQINSESTFYCSEYIAYVYNNILKLFPEWAQVDINDLYRDKRFTVIHTGKFLK